MKASQILGGLTLGQADMIRKGVSKKKRDLMNRWIDLMIYGSEEYKRAQQELFVQYPTEDSIPTGEDGKPSIWVDYEYMKKASTIPDGIEGALARGYDIQTLRRIKQEWLKFGEYCFNKAHSAAYALLSCITAWMKAYYPVEFMAALLTMSEGKKDKNKVPRNIHYMKECEEMGMRILPPDVNTSMSGWTPNTYQAPVEIEGKYYFGEIRYGLTSIAKISGETVNEIIAHRPYKNLADMIERTNGTKVNKTKVESLIKSGSFDFMTKNRNLLLREFYGSRKEAYEHLPGTTTKAHIMAFEIEVFGVSVSAKSRWSKVEEGGKTQITGTVSAVEEWTARSSGKKHYTVTVDTNEEPIAVTVWGYLMDQSDGKLAVGNKVTVKGEKSRDNLTMKSVTLLTQETAGEFEVDLQPA